MGVAGWNCTMMSGTLASITSRASVSWWIPPHGLGTPCLDVTVLISCFTRPLRPNSRPKVSQMSPELTSWPDLNAPFLEICAGPVGPRGGSEEPRMKSPNWLQSCGLALWALTYSRKQQIRNALGFHKQSQGADPACPSCTRSGRQRRPKCRPATWPRGRQHGVPRKRRGSNP